MPRFALFLAAVAPLWALAQAPPPGFELERVALNAGAGGGLAADTGDALPAGRLRVALAGHYEHQPLLLAADGLLVGAAVGWRVTAHLLAAWAPAEWCDLALQLPVVAAQGGDDLTPYGVAPVQSFALGAPQLHARLALLRQAKAGGEGAPVDLTVGVGVGLPLGSSAALTKDAGVGLSLAPRLGLGRDFGPVRLGLEAGALVRGARALGSAGAVGADEVGSALVVAAAASAGPSWLRGEVTARGFVPLTQAPFGLELLAGARLRTPARGVELFVLGGPGFGRSPGVPAFRALLGAGWAGDLGG